MLEITMDESNVLKNHHTRKNKGRLSARKSIFRIAYVFTAITPLFFNFSVNALLL